MDTKLTKSDLAEDLLLARSVITRTLQCNFEMILKLVSFSKDGSAWEFRHGGDSIAAPMLDAFWLHRFHQGEFRLKSGDAVRVKVEVFDTYRFDNELASRQYFVVEVLELLN